MEHAAIRLEAAEKRPFMNSSMLILPPQSAAGRLPPGKGCPQSGALHRMWG